MKPKKRLHPGQLETLFDKYDWCLDKVGKTYSFYLYRENAFTFSEMVKAKTALGLWKKILKLLNNI